MKYRYPGISSFETTDEDIFFGRENDRRQLTNAVTVKKSLLLYARSGMGKSSLLKAALIPELLNKGYLPYYVRLGVYQETHSLPLTQTLLRRTVLKDNKEPLNTWLQKFTTHNYSLWASFKAIQAAALANGNPQQPIVLIIDQFEELFSYPPNQITEFKQQLAELLYTAIPQNYLDALEDSDFLMTSPLTSTETDAFYTPLQVKVVFSIRSDQMSLLNELTDYLPTILKEFYELKPRTEQQALEAITAPAQEKGEFYTPTFVYQEDAQKKILKALSSQKQKGIDTAQLQIVLQYIEKDIVEAKQDYDLTAEDLGDLNKVYENYYYNSLAKLPNVTEKEKARRLIEDKLIVEGRRISYDEQLCLQQVNTTTLTTLVETRLLRREPNSTDGFSYELSHDTLVKPVLDAKKLYDEEQEKLRQAEELRISKIEKAKRERQIRVLSVAFVIAILAVIGAVYFGFDAQKQKEKALEAEEEAIIARYKAEKAQKEAQKALADFYEGEVKKLEDLKSIMESDGKTKAVAQYTIQIDSLQNLIKKLK
jgi:hypothetical protein